MSITAKDGKSITKKEFRESSEAQQGFKNLVFYHEATAGETSIDLTALNTPSGQVNPSSSDLADAKLFRFKNNLVLVSTLRGTLINNIAYKVNSGTRISLKFEAEENEIFFGILQSVPVQIQGIESKTPAVEGDLTDGTTDFAIGFSTKTKYDEILVFRNGLEQKRNSDNSDTLLDGNYHVVDNGSGFGSVIRFNTAASGQDDYIKVTAIGGVVSSPTDSVFDEIQKLQGQIDAMVVDLADATGNPETDYQGTPNDVDLRQFGARVLGMEEPGQPGVPLQATAVTAGANVLNKIQHKDFATVANGASSGGSFNNLVPGKWYELKFGCLSCKREANGFALVRVQVDTVPVAQVGLNASGTISEPEETLAGPTGSYVFKYVSGTLIEVRALTDLAGSEVSNPFGTLIERNDLVETAEFT